MIAFSDESGCAPCIRDNQGRKYICDCCDVEVAGLVVGGKRIIHVCWQCKHNGDHHLAEVFDDPDYCCDCPDELIYPDVEAGKN